MKINWKNVWAINADPKLKAVHETLTRIKAEAASGILMPIEIVPRPRKLEALSPAMREELGLKIAWPAERICEWLLSKGVRVSRQTVSRYLQKERQKEAMVAREEMAASAEEFAKGKKGEGFRVGTLEALRQKMYEHALKSENAAEALGMYRAALAEEEKLKRLEMDRERLALQREGLLLQKQRLQLEAARGNVKLLLEAAGILRDEALGDGAKVARLRDRLRDVLEVEAQVVMGKEAADERERRALGAGEGTGEMPNDKTVPMTKE